MLNGLVYLDSPNDEEAAVLLHGKKSRVYSAWLVGFFHFAMNADTRAETITRVKKQALDRPGSEAENG